MDERKRGLLREVERALLDAISESNEVHRSLSRLQRAGYTLHLFLDCAAEREGSPQAPVFRINGQDLKLLRSLGIDPTRKHRRRSRVER